MKKVILTAMAAFMVSASALAADSTPGGQVITRSGVNPSVSVPKANFTGQARMENLFKAQGKFTAYGANVTFEPGARTHWHIHPNGQVLIVTAGAGYTQEWGKAVQAIYPGDVVWCPPGVKHWHGATATTAMSHTAISQTGDPVIWLEEVDDNSYPQ